jgi:hypothetical protein
MILYRPPDRQPIRDDGQSGSVCTGGKRVHYKRRRPEETTLYTLVQEQVEGFFVQVERETGAGL